jgi:hypothetical protein
MHAWDLQLLPSSAVILWVPGSCVSLIPTLPNGCDVGIGSEAPGGGQDHPGPILLFLRI